MSPNDLSMLRIMAPIVAAGFALGALLSFKLMRRSWLRAQPWLAAGAVTQGVVVEHLFRRYNNSDGGVTEGYVAVVAYRAPNGESHRKLFGRPQTSPLPLGARTAIAYDRTDPSEGIFVETARAMWMWGWIMTVAFGVLAVAHLVLAIVLAFG